MKAQKQIAARWVASQRGIRPPRRLGRRALARLRFRALFAHVRARPS